MGRSSLHYRQSRRNQRRRDDDAGGKRLRPELGSHPGPTGTHMRQISASALVFLLASACSIRPDQAPDTPLHRACQYLWTQQAADGGWHSRAYGLLKSGQSPTPFVLNALLQAPCPAPAGGVDRAVAFLKRNTNAEGAVGKTDPLLYDYPNYA